MQRSYLGAVSYSSGLRQGTIPQLLISPFFLELSAFNPPASSQTDTTPRVWLHVEHDLHSVRISTCLPQTQEEGGWALGQ